MVVRKKEDSSILRLDLAHLACRLIITVDSFIISTLHIALATRIRLEYLLAFRISACLIIQIRRRCGCRNCSASYSMSNTKASGPLLAP
ncbi:hypothetical protein PILCRDRAFT_682464 [Piloderma croceum F 1598]|uniref:Uncharacterized protein n=1 Tax=Piloderma croceum (strain F 1598) TaxID=765440 RepID=A0A0C3AMV4_PILCF|nr:hypothetical protein PILCRDRAFT_682464 [Piloderma croceum F 1598]